MRKRELIDRIEKLEKVVAFLSKYDKDAIVEAHGWSLRNTGVKYLYNSEVKCAKIHCDTFKVLENLSEYVIVRGDSMYFGATYSRYYKIDKETAMAQEIPKPAFVLEQELAEKKTTKKNGKNIKK